MVEGHKTILMTKLTESKMVHREKLTHSQVAGSPRGIFLGPMAPRDPGAQGLCVQWTEVQGTEALLEREIFQGGAYLFQTF